jgi:hypothetical protein
MTTSFQDVVKAIRDGLPALRKGQAIDQYSVFVRRHRGGWNVDRAIDLIEDRRVLTFLGCPVLFFEVVNSDDLDRGIFPGPTTWPDMELALGIDSERRSSSAPYHPLTFTFATAAECDDGPLKWRLRDRLFRQSRSRQLWV